MGFPSSPRLGFSNREATRQGTGEKREEKILQVIRSVNPRRFKHVFPLAAGGGSGGGGGLSAQSHQPAAHLHDAMRLPVVVIGGGR